MVGDFMHAMFCTCRYLDTVVPLQFLSRFVEGSNGAIRLSSSWLSPLQLIYNTLPTAALERLLSSKDWWFSGSVLVGMVISH